MSTGEFDTPAPAEQVYVCGACGRQARTVNGLKDTSCRTWATLCFKQKTKDGAWRAVPQED